MEGIKNKQFAEGEFPIEGDNLGIELKDRYLFHGSIKPSLEKFLTSKEADEANITDGATFGQGLYLTSSEKAAKAYAYTRKKAYEYKRRLDSKINKEDDKMESTFYIVRLENLKLLDLRTQENISQFSHEFHKYLIENLKNKSYSHNSYVQNSMIKALDEIEKGIELHNIHSLTGYAMTGVFTDFTKQAGYDGAVTLEGGEGHEEEYLTHTGDHDTYIIFNPEKVSIIDKNKI